MAATGGLTRRLARLERTWPVQPPVPRLDPVALATRAGLPPDGWQGAVLRAQAPRVLLNCSRQSGKSSVAAVLAVHCALYEAPALVLLVSRAQRQAQELFRKCLDVYRATGRLVPTDAESGLRIELENGSRIIALPGAEETTRGYSGVRLLAIDEASRVSDALYHALRPTLAVSAGRLLALSTPWGQRGWWHAAWVSDEPWLRVEVPATQCPRIPPAFLEEERRAQGELKYASEYECRFVDVEDSVFSGEQVQAALDPTVAPLWEVA